MDVHRRIPFIDGRRHEHAVAHDAGIVHHDMQITKGGHGRVDNALRPIPIGDVFIVGDGVSTRRLDFRHHSVGSARITPFAAQRSADVIDDDVGPFRCKGERIGTSQPTCGPGDDDRPVVANTHYNLSIIVTLA